MKGPKVNERTVEAILNGYFLVNTPSPAHASAAVEMAVCEGYKGAYRIDEVVAIRFVKSLESNRDMYVRIQNINIY